MIIAYHIYDNCWTKKRFLLDNKKSCSGSTHAGMSLTESLTYINQVFNDYLKYSGISPTMIQNKRVLEIGPGDNFGVALKFLVAGAQQVVCLDKFYSKRDTEQQCQIYREIRTHLKDNERCIYDTIINLDGNVDIKNEKLLYIHGVGIEEADAILEPGSFDLIVSRAVIEHLYDPDTAFSVMNNLLRSGGIMIHKIDFRDHGLFSGKGFHPLTYLTIPDPVYKLMTYDSDKPNRRLITYYTKKMTELGYDGKILITNIVGSDIKIVPYKETILHGLDYSDSTINLIKKIRSRLRCGFKDMSDEELMVQGIFLIAKKP
jgi:SAM-dependent methyltransferase